MVIYSPCLAGMEPGWVQGSRAGDQQAGNSSIEKDGSLQGNGLYLLHYLK